MKPADLVYVVVLCDAKGVEMGHELLIAGVGTMKPSFPLRLCVRTCSRYRAGGNSNTQAGAGGHDPSCL